MTLIDVEHRAFEPGTTGWTARDLDDPRVEALWLQGRYEIVEGVLTRMAPAFFTGGKALHRLLFLATLHLEQNRTSAGVIRGSFAPEVDLVLSEDRVVVADAVFLTPGDELRQADAAREAGRPDPRRARLYVPPTLVVESVSPGHESHDRRTKRRWYAEFGVPHYWLMNVFDRSLECLAREGAEYRVDAAGRDHDEVRPSLFPGLLIPLRAVWDE